MQPWDPGVCCFLCYCVFSISAAPDTQHSSFSPQQIEQGVIFKKPSVFRFPLWEHSGWSSAWLWHNQELITYFLLKISQMGSVRVLTKVLLRKIEIPVRVKLDLTNIQPRKAILLSTQDVPVKESCRVYFRDILNGFLSRSLSFLGDFHFTVSVFKVVNTMQSMHLGSCPYLKPVLRISAFPSS